MSSLTLKEPRICRVFVSSPFGGFEKEREELVVKYLPQLSHMCQSKGVQFVTVDMRWGITEEAATDAQVVNICLREVDRSDIFVGFYGQRYGWHGETDRMFQKNIENAMKRYQWLRKVKDRSVTEMEFMHGHLNNPGRLPSIFAFRDKAYDNAERSKAEQAQDTKTALKFMYESSSSKQLLDQLKARVIKTRDQCWALQENYKTPQEGAEFVFNELKKCLQSILSKSQAVFSKRDLNLASHDAYLISRATIFVGGKTHEKVLDLALEKDGQNVLIVGPTGAGKGALLAHWLSTLTNKTTQYCPIYYFVGCSSESACVPEILLRLIEELHHVMGDMRTSKSDSLTIMAEDIKPKSSEIVDLYREFEQTLTKAASSHKILLAIDGLGKVQQTSRISKTMFWLPKELPKNVTVVVTCRDCDHDVLQELMSRGYTSLHIPQLSKQVREEMCKELLKHNSKELSPAQLKSIVDSEQTGSPLYLKTVVSELCAFGKFCELNEKIEELMNCWSVKELFQVFIRRLEEDYRTDKKRNITEQVLCSLRVSRKGLSEKELMAMHKIPCHEWSPLFFAMQHVIDEAAGLIKLGSHELSGAVDDKYLTEAKTKLKYQRILVNYFEKLRKEEKAQFQLDDASVLRPAEELPWLLHAMGDKTQLAEVLSDLSIFGRLFLDQEYELIDLWRSTGLSGEQIVDMYLNSIQSRAANILKDKTEKLELSGADITTLMSYLNALTYFMEVASYKSGQEKVLMTQMRMMKDAEGKVSEEIRKHNQARIKTKLAYLYSDTGRYKEAADLHQEVLTYRNEVLAQAKSKPERKTALKGLASTYHGIAILNSNLGNVQEAIDYYTRAMTVEQELDNEVEVADSLHNLGVMYMKIGKYQQALKLCQQSLQMYKNLYFGILPPAIGLMMGNIAVCHRNLGQIEEAEKMYLRALEISQRSVGRQHPYVALGLMNLGTLEINRKQFERAEVYLRESIDIFHKCETLTSDLDYYRSLEKFVYVLIKVNKAEEAVPFAQELFTIAVRENFLDSCWPNVYLAIVDILIVSRLFPLAEDMTLALLKSKQAQDTNYLHYDIICKALQQKPKPEYSIEKAFQAKPSNLLFLRHVIETIYIPEDALCKILKSVDIADATLKVGADLYGTVVMWCQEANRPNLVLAILEHSIQLFPSETNFICCLAQRYYDKEDYCKAMEYSGRMCQLEPMNPNHYLMNGDAAMRCGQFSQAKKTFEDMIAKFGQKEEIASRAGKALNIISSMESKQLAANKS